MDDECSGANFESGCAETEKTSIKLEKLTFCSVAHQSSCGIHINSGPQGIVRIKGQSNFNSRENPHIRHNKSIEVGKSMFLQIHDVTGFLQAFFGAIFNIFSILHHRLVGYPNIPLYLVCRSIQ